MRRDRGTAMKAVLHDVRDALLKRGSSDKLLFDCDVAAQKSQLKEVLTSLNLTSTNANVDTVRRALYVALTSRHVSCHTHRARARVTVRRPRTISDQKRNAKSKSA